MNQKPTPNKRIAVVIPTKNEAASIERVVAGISAEIKKLGHEVAGVIITDDSHDRTRVLARQAGARVVIGEGKGLGFAMWKGLKAALSLEPEIIISMDADGQSRVDELESFLAPILEDRADFVLGSRFQKQGLVHYHYRWKNRIGVRILVKILRRFTQLPLTDSHGGLRAMIPDVARELEMIGTHTYVQETIIDAHEKGFRIVEIPSAWDPRKSGKSRVVRSIPLYVFYTLPVLVLRSGQHIRFLYTAGIGFVFLSFADFVVVGVQTRFNLQVLFDRQSFHLIFMLLSIGLNLFFFGFTLELVNRIKRRVDRMDSLSVRLD